MDADRNNFKNDFKKDLKGGGSDPGKTPQPTPQPAPRAQGTVTPDGVDLKKSFLYSRLELIRTATEGFTREQLSNVAQNLASLDCEKFAQAHPDFSAFNELMYIRSGLEEAGTEGYRRLAMYAEMFPEPVPAVIRAVDALTDWCGDHPEDSLAQVILGQFEELRGERESVNRRLNQVLINESRGLPTDDAMLLWAQMAIICDFDGWITRNFGIPTPVKSEVSGSKEDTTCSGGSAKTAASAAASGVAAQVNGLPMIRKVAFFAAAGAAVLSLLAAFRGFSNLLGVAAAALLAYLILKGKDLEKGNVLMAVPKTLNAVVGVLSLLTLLRWRVSILLMIPLLISLALTVVLWLAVLGRMTDRRKLAVLLVGGFAAEILLTLLFGRSMGFFGLLASLGYSAAYLLIAYLTYKDALKK